MPDTRTPGQVAYDAYASLPGARRAEPWTDLPSWEQQRWEAAAQAVLYHATVRAVAEAAVQAALAQRAQET
jgi:hypothetical protein